MKLDLKKEFGKLYKAASKVEVVKVPKQKIISVEGAGGPNSVGFKNAIETLYPVAYTLKFFYKKEGSDYSVMPLEGLWWADDMNDFVFGKKENWKWKIFIVQPDFVTKEAFNKIIKKVKEKKNPVSIDKLQFETLNEGSSAQLLHVGPYSEEANNIKKIHDFIHSLGNSFDGKIQKHHEIYLSDMRKTAPEKLKTILRQPFI